ncbi:MAG: hypothetical protein IPF82_16970 [Blastocatellia bacterium]|nr:hypothetical protein [Blastocatellia bacterium]
MCCKGFGFGGSLERHVRSLFVLYPALEATVVSRNANFIDLSTPPTGCHFLETDNHCGIEARHGRSAKPGVCSLFPFNNLRRLGPAVVVIPHFLCPLRVVVPPLPGRVEGTHATLVGSVAESGMLGADGRGAHLPSVPVRAGATLRDVVSEEVAFRNACSAALGRGRFRDVVRDAASDNSAFDADMQRSAAILGLATSKTAAGRDRLDEILLTLAPALRLEYLRLSPDGVVRALALTELLIRVESELSERMLEPQVTFRSATVRRPGIQLLAHGDEPLSIKRALSAKAPRSVTRNSRLRSFSRHAVLLRAQASHLRSKRLCSRQCRPPTG